MAHANVVLRESEYEQWLDVVDVGPIPISEDTDDIFLGSREVARSASMTSLRRALIKLRGTEPPPPLSPITIEDPDTGETRVWHPPPWRSPERIAVELVDLPKAKFAARRSSTYSVSPEPVALALLNGGVLAVRVEFEVRGPQEPTAARLREVAAPFLDRVHSEVVHVDADPHGSWADPVTRAVDVPDFWIVRVYVAVPSRGKSVGDCLPVGYDLLALFEAAEGGELDRSTTEALIDSGRARLLVGFPEGPWLDCKEQPYARTDHGQDELAKDVSAFANSSGGGVIVIGLRTRKRFGRDTVTALAPVPRDDRRVDRYRKIVSRRVHPRVVGLDIREIDYATGVMVVISIPPQAQALQPFMVRGAYRGGKLVGSHIAIYYREGDAAAVASVEEIHSLVVAGRAALGSASSERSSSG